MGSTSTPADPNGPAGSQSRAALAAVCFSLAAIVCATTTVLAPRTSGAWHAVALGGCIGVALVALFVGGCLLGTTLGARRPMGLFGRPRF